MNSLKGKPIYVEIPIRAEMENLWEVTQNPKLHEQWDLRFTSIEYLPKKQGEPQSFLYETKIGFGIKIAGWGKSVGYHEGNHGVRTSSLHFGTDQKLSIIREGRGFWKYEPKDDHIKFFTQYDYDVHWGLFGKVFDLFIFRPLMGWMTALSFDVLRRWLEKGEPPRIQFTRFFMSWFLIWTFVSIWLYHGLIPKILFPNAEEISMLEKVLGIDPPLAQTLTTIIGIGEIIFGLLLIILKDKRHLFLTQLILFPILGGGALLANSEYFAHPFSPLTFNLALIVLSLIGFVFYKDLPTAKNCKRKRSSHVDL